MTTLVQRFDNIATEYHKSCQYLEALRKRMEQLKQAGMYPAASTERWKDDRYLYLYFPSGAPGLILDAKGRLYIGANLGKIEEARRLAGNYEQHNRLEHQASRLSAWIAGLDREITQLAARAGNWPHLTQGEESQLGLDLVGQPGEMIPT